VASQPAQIAHARAIAACLGHRKLQFVEAWHRRGESRKDGAPENACRSEGPADEDEGDHPIFWRNPIF
jgi:hypothetical protein